MFRVVEWPSRACELCVNTTHATTGATTLLLPVQNTHTLHDPIRENETRSMRAIAALSTLEQLSLRMLVLLDGLGVCGLDGGDRC